MSILMFPRSWELLLTFFHNAKVAISMNPVKTVNELMQETHRLKILITKSFGDISSICGIKLHSTLPT